MQYDAHDINDCFPLTELTVMIEALPLLLLLFFFKCGTE